MATAQDKEGHGLNLLPRDHFNSLVSPTPAAGLGADLPHRTLGRKGSRAWGCLGALASEDEG